MWHTTEVISPKHKIFCSYAFTGEDKAVVVERMRLITDTFRAAGVEAYCNLFDTKVEGLSGAKQFMDVALEELEVCDLVFVVMASERRSEGMLIEIGAAYAAGKPIILACHTSADGTTYLNQLAVKTLHWHTNQDLTRLIETLTTT